MRLTTICLIIFFMSCAQKVQENVRSLDSTQLMCGTVQFANACGPQIDSLLALGIALYHHMTFEEARDNFQTAIDIDPDCMWGYWGKALTYLHPIWPDAPSQEMLHDGLNLTRLSMRRASTQREKLFSNALFAYYNDATDKTEAARLATYEAAWSAVHDALPEDLEAKSFYVLAHLATVDPGDKTYSKQLHAGALARSILDEIPDHPAGFHYVIHSYDYPAIAEKALEVARNYGKIAPAIPHALHMPTHIFTRLGLWDESVDWNILSAKAALEHPVKGAVSLHHFHALDYQVYAHLQKGQDDEAIQVMNDMFNLSPPWQFTFPTAYALAAIPARIALERRRWDDAAHLESRRPSHVDWERFPEFVAINEFARGLGLARLGRTDDAMKIVQGMNVLQANVANTSKNAYWGNQIEIQKNVVVAWVRYAEGNTDDAIRIMEKAADMESATSKNPVTPGEVLPVRELLADMYADLGQHNLAMRNYELALERSPNRLNSLIGAAKSAHASGDEATAVKYLNDFNELTKDASSPRVHAVSDVFL